MRQPALGQQLSFSRLTTAIWGFLIILSAISTTSHQAIAQDDTTVIGRLKAEATLLQPLVTSDVAIKFLQAVPELPRIPDNRILYFNKTTREMLSEASFQALSDSAKIGFDRRELDEGFYYYTRYGTPLAFVRPLDLVASAGLTSLDGARIIDFGFGSIGQLRLMASLGATAVGIDVDPMLTILYGESSDSGQVPRAAVAGEGSAGRMLPLIGSFPNDTAVTSRLNGAYDVFFSKNTLKRGYIHPEGEADPRQLIDLGVSDSVFVKHVYDLLRPGGYFMIYNLHPAQAAPTEKYIPWADGRSPFTRELFEQASFTVLAFDTDDTEFARTMAKALGWDAQMDLEKDLFGTYTLVRK